jgi:hypothetical protein
LDLSRFKKRTAGLAVLREMYSPRLDLSGEKKRTGAMAVLREMYSPRLDLQAKRREQVPWQYLVECTVPGWISRVKEENRCHGST